MTNTSCVITMCDNENDQLVPVCARHFIHMKCLEEYITKTTTPTCPICRDDYLVKLKGMFVGNAHQQSNVYAFPIRFKPHVRINF